MDITKVSNASKASKAFAISFSGVCYLKRLSISVTIVSGSVFEEKRLTTFPFWSMRNLAKFHSIRLPRGPLA